MANQYIGEALNGALLALTVSLTMLVCAFRNIERALGSGSIARERAKSRHVATQEPRREVVGVRNRRTPHPTITLVLVAPR